MPKLRISGAMWYLLWFLGRNERNKCGGVPKWIYMVGNLREKRKVDCSKRPSEKKKKWYEKNGLEKKSRSAIWALLCKVSGIDDIWKEKNCAPLVFRNTLCLIYIFSS